ncbi:MAG: hypothetical protein PHW04_11075 [Candidatus Wallbacteria bacterium]|nr:hypothetical protein [Candidatus Wallbacteria bacterium]
MKYTLNIDQVEFTVEFEETSKMSDLHKVLINGTEHEVSISSDLSSVLIGGKSHQIKSFLVIDGRPTRIEVDDHLFGVDFKDEHAKKSGRSGKSTGIITAPLQGVVSSLSAKLGHRVAEKDVLLTIEAMKMQNEIHADVNGTVKNIMVKAGDTVREHDLLIEIEPDSAET